MVSVTARSFESWVLPFPGANLTTAISGATLGLTSVYRALGGGWQIGKDDQSVERRPQTRCAPASTGCTAASAPAAATACTGTSGSRRYRADNSAARVVNISGGASSLISAGRLPHSGSKTEVGQRKRDFRSTPECRYQADIAGGPKSAISGSRKRSWRGDSCAFGSGHLPPRAQNLPGQRPRGKPGTARQFRNPAARTAHRQQSRPRA
jgi:hypothetical protein